MAVNALLLLLAKATLLLGFAFLVVRWERTAPALRRHGVWSVTFVSLLALPLLAIILPALRIPVPAIRPVAETPVEPRIFDRLVTPPVEQPFRAPVVEDVMQFAVVDPSLLEFPRLALSQVLTVLWICGVLAALFALARSLILVRRLASSGSRFEDPQWVAAAKRIANRLGLLAVPKLVVSDAVSSPMAGVLAEPVVFLPPDAASWDAERRDVVLIHELTHLARRDPLRIVAARVACAFYWFHPLVWVAARRATAECEQACDENVIALGVRPSTYARLLLEFANRSEPVVAAALPIVHRHRLETRVMAILNSTDGVRRVSTRRTVSVSLAALTMLVTVAAARPAALEPASRTAVTTLPAVAVPVPATPTVRAEAPNIPVKNAVAPTTPRLTEPGTPLVMQDGRCWNRYDRVREFSGSTTMTNGRILNRIGRIGRERIAQMTLGDLQICMVTDGFDGSELREPSTWISNSDLVILETETDRDNRRLEIARGRSTWFVNGRSAEIDDNVTAWRRALLDVLDASWEASELRGRESSLRGEISSIEGERSSLRGEISSLRGEVSSMRGEISSLLGEHSSMQGEISSIRGHENSLRGQISSERGSISSLEAERWERSADRSAIDARIRRHEDAIRDIEREIARYDADGRVRAVERRINAFDVDRKVAEIERRIREFDVERKVERIEREIAGLDVEGQRTRLEREIRDLDVSSRLPAIMSRRDAAIDRLRSLLRR